MRASKCGWRILNTFAPVCAVLTTLTKAYTWSRAATFIQVNINIISTHKKGPLVSFIHISICPESFCEILFHCTFFSSFLNILTKLFLSTEFKSIYFALSTAENISEYRKIE